MIPDYYIRELDLLRRTARVFADENPSLAPMLGDPCNDPDIERLLEGTAFLTGMIKRKIDDDFPEMVHDLFRQVWPHALKPIPSTTVVAFTPDLKLSDTLVVERGAFVDSCEDKGTSCRFRTCYDVEVHPVSVKDVLFTNNPGSLPVLRITFELKSTGLQMFNADSLVFHLSGPYREATHIYMLLKRNIKDILFGSDGCEEMFRPGLESLGLVGFEKDEALIPWPSCAFDGFRLIQEYFLLPEKFLFVELKNMSKWTDRPDSKSFYVDFVFDSTDSDIIDIGARHITLFAAPAVNVYPQNASPVIVDHGKTYYSVKPSDSGKNSQVHSILAVRGYSEGCPTGIKIEEYKGWLNPYSECCYREKLCFHRSDDRLDVMISLAFGPVKKMSPLKSLSFDLLVTQGDEPVSLNEGDRLIMCSDAPQSVCVRNLRKPTMSALPDLDTDIAWKLISFFSLNLMSIKNAEDLKAMLRLFVIDNRKDRSRNRINEHKIKGIRDFRSKSVTRMIGGVPLRGLEITVVLSKTNFASMGDVVLFGTVMSHFFGMYSTINTFTRLIVEELDTGETICWNERMGRGAL